MKSMSNGSKPVEIQNFLCLYVFCAIFSLNLGWTILFLQTESNLEKLWAKTIISDFLF